MNSNQTIFRPVAEPRVIENAYSDDQHRRMLDVVRRNGPWKLILAQHFKSAEEVIATTSGSVPEGVTPSFDMFLTPVFRGYFAQGHTAVHTEIEDCFFNQRFLDLVRSYWQADYARPSSMLFNIQGACPGSGTPHVDATRFRGLDDHTTPVWVSNMMVKSGLFRRWQAKRAQVIAWYYKGRIGGGFNYWPDGLQGAPKQIKAPMWGRAVVVENEMMYHTAEASGPAAQRRPEGLAFESVIRADPDSADAWQILTGDRVIQQIAGDDLRFLVHWGADIFKDLAELKVTLDHSDDLTTEQIFDIFVSDLRHRGIAFQMPSDPLSDTAFIGLLTKVYDPGVPQIFPAEPADEPLAA